VIRIELISGSLSEYVTLKEQISGRAARRQLRDLHNRVNLTSGKRCPANIDAR
jgi:hypothetical protein